MSRVATLEIHRCQMRDGWEALREPKEWGNDWSLMLPCQCFADVFDMAFPDVIHTKWKSFSKGVVGAFLKGVLDSELEDIRRFLYVMRDRIVVQDLTDASIALGLRATCTDGNWERTEIGQLIKDAKPYDGTATKAHLAAAVKIAEKMGDFMEAIGIYKNVTAIVAVPPSNPAKTYRVPAVLVALLAKRFSIEDASERLKKSTATPQLKNLTREQKAKALEGSLVIEDGAFDGDVVLLVDDLYQSGTTLNFVAEAIREAGAAQIFGLAAVKTMSNHDNVRDKHHDDDPFNDPI